MGRWKPKNTLPIGRVAPSRAATEAAARFAADGVAAKVRATPRGLPSVSGVVSALVAPFRTEATGAEELREMQLLASMAALAWNLSRFERKGGAAAELVDSTWAHLRALGEGAAEPVVERMLERARTMHPDDTRIIVKTHVERDGRYLHIQAAATEMA